MTKVKIELFLKDTDNSFVGVGGFEHDALPVLVELKGRLYLQDQDAPWRYVETPPALFLDERTALTY